MPADIFARYHRMVGNRVAMVSGSDMHGTPTALRAVDEGVRPEDIAFRYHEIWAACMERMGFSYDLYTHTHTKIHEEVAQGRDADARQARLYLRRHSADAVFGNRESVPVGSFSSKESARRATLMVPAATNATAAAGRSTLLT